MKKTRNLPIFVVLVSWILVGGIASSDLDIDVQFAPPQMASNGHQSKLDNASKYAIESAMSGIISASPFPRPCQGRITKLTFFKTREEWVV